MRLLLAPQELKGTLSAAEAAAVIARGVREARPGIEIVVAPLADGGPGTVEAVLAGRGGRWHSTPVHDPLGAPCAARWGLLDDGTAVIEMSAASGLSLLAGRALRPLEANSRGTGELIRAALEAGARRLIVGLGGSATTDGGTGAIAALGARFRDAEGHELPLGGGALEALAEIHVSGLDPRLSGLDLVAATDVQSPLLGPDGAARRFGPQKGASPHDVERLERGLEHLAELSARTLGSDLSREPGTGAAGGLGFALRAFLGAELRSGFEVVSEALGLEAKVRAADWVITGEGRLDATSLAGKGPFALALLAHRHGKPSCAFVGQTDGTTGPFDEVVVAPGSDRASATAALERAAQDWARRHA